MDIIADQETVDSGQSDYEAFLASKVKIASSFGRAVDASDVHASLYPFQRAIVQWACMRGRAAIWCDTGLGKTRLQLEWSRLMGERTLILAPLAVAQQTIREAAAIGIDVTYVRSQAAADMAGPIVIANYEMLDHFATSAFGAVVLDESSILKAYTGATKRMLVERFAQTTYRLACTATPAPNDHMELGNHAEFLGIMRSNEMLSRWFINDPMMAGAYRLKGHAVDDFWRWITSWAVCCSMPSDLSPDFDDAPYQLPPLRFVDVPVAEPEDRALKLGRLFLDGGTVAATEIWRDKSITAEARCAAAARIVATKPDVPWAVWCDTNEESGLLARMIPGAVEVRGDQSLDEKEARLFAFADGRSRIIISKASLSGFGVNWQHCADTVFVGRTYSYEKLYQAVRRTWRYGQTRPVTVYLISVESEGGIADSIARKQEAHEVMKRQMVLAAKAHGLAQSIDAQRTIRPITTTEGDRWTLHTGDCVQGLRQRPDNSVDLTVSSPPFSNLYIYSDALEDLGNSASHIEFFTHLGYLTKELFRVTRPGRLCCFHCKDLPLYMNRDGAAGLYDFPGALVRAFEASGWTFHSRVTIWKDPVIEMQRTKNHGLLHRNFVTRGEVCRQGMADYVLVFRAHKGEADDKQIQRTPEPGDYIGDNPPERWDSRRDWSIQLWQKYASPVWFDVQQPRVLQYMDAGDATDERHICPLQLDVIDRCIWLWSNPGEVVCDPFMGIGSTGHQAILLGRQALGYELKPAYAAVAERNFIAAMQKRTQGSLFPANVDDEATA